MKTISTMALTMALALGAHWSAAADLRPTSQNGVTYLSGGVGEEERQAMLDARGDYKLLLTFSTKGSGEMLADVAVTIRDHAGKEVASLVSPGPMCYLDLAPGSYRILASAHGKEISRTAVVKPRGRRELYFYWDPV
ncbi:carboxypeptidase regulatory-like domain-containing protein [Duganella sp. LjRoot269]|jgi:hypothetical protein|uniref:carboxypeptidase regulatory-like domain-containing protein n=1 Tax=Duganella sp. LjRoot269 TaxID=3342305 RepID=UPI003ECF5B2B